MWRLADVVSQTITWRGCLDALRLGRVMVGLAAVRVPGQVRVPRPRGRCASSRNRLVSHTLVRTVGCCVARWAEM